jgi:DHA1 family inner membrane transport protein
MPTIVGSLIALAVVLLAMTAVIHQPVLMVIAIALFGAAAFATVAPLQMWVLAKAEGAGQGAGEDGAAGCLQMGHAGPAVRVCVIACRDSVRIAWLLT